MEITDIRIKKLTNLGRLVGDATITFNDCFVVHGVQIIQTDDKRFITFPSKVLKNGSKVDVVHPITQEFRSYIESEIFKIFDKLESDR